MLANGRAFLLLGVDLTVTQAHGQRIGNLAGGPGFPCPAEGLPGTLNPRPAAMSQCPVRPQWRAGQAGSAGRLSAGWYYGDYLDTPNGAVSRVYVFAHREIRGAI